MERNCFVNIHGAVIILSQMLVHCDFLISSSFFFDFTKKRTLKMLYLKNIFKEMHECSNVDSY